MSGQDDDFDAQYAESKRLLAESERRLAYSTGQLHARIDALAEDPEHVELLRGLAWARTGVKLGALGDKITGVPDGWPEGVDPDEFVREHLDRCKEQHAPGPATSEKPEARVSPAVKRFRDLLG